MHAVSNWYASADSFLFSQRYYSNEILPQLFTISEKDFSVEVSLQWNDSIFKSKTRQRANQFLNPYRNTSLKKDKKNPKQKQTKKTK